MNVGAPIAGEIIGFLAWGLLDFRPGAGGRMAEIVSTQESRYLIGGARLSHRFGMSGRSDTLRRTAKAGCFSFTR